MKLVVEAAFCPSVQESWNNSFFIFRLSVFSFSLTCNIKGGTFLVLIPLLKNRLVFSCLRPADTGTDSPSLPCSSAQRLRKSFSPVCMAKVRYRLGLVWCLKRNKETVVMQRSSPMKWGNRASAGHISESLASGARHFEGLAQEPVPHKHTPVQKERGSKRAGSPALTAFFSLPALGTARLI